MFNMVPSQIYKGIEYVQLDDLPFEQKERIQKTLNRDFFIKILVNGVILSNCIQYKDYRNWFEEVFSKSIAVEKVKQADELLPSNVAFKPA